MGFSSVPSYFSKPVFGADSTGLSFGSSPLSTSAFGSIPSYANNASSVKPLELAKPTGMDPFSIGAAVLAPVIGGIFGQSAAQKQADATKEAAQYAAAQTKAAARIGSQTAIAQGEQDRFNQYLANVYQTGMGGARERLNNARNMVQQANIEAFNPAFITARSVAGFRERLNNAMPAFVDPREIFS